MYRYVQLLSNRPHLVILVSGTFSILALGKQHENHLFEITKKFKKLRMDFYGLFVTFDICILFNNCSMFIHAEALTTRL